MQKVEDDPCLFRTTYFGNHTCTHSFPKASELILDSVSSSPREESDSKFMIIFENTNNLTYKQERPFFSSYSSTEREIIKPNHVASIQSSSCDYLGDKLTVFESSDLISGLLKTMEFDHEDMLYYRTINDGILWSRNFANVNFDEYLRVGCNVSVLCSEIVCFSFFSV